MKKTILLIVLLLIVAISLSIFKGSGDEKIDTLATQEVSQDNPADIVADFYAEWLLFLKSDDKNPLKSTTVDTRYLSQNLQESIKEAKDRAEEELDPVLCQTTTDIDIATRRVLEQEDEVRILVTARDKELTGQAVVQLLARNDGWFINSITCYPGEFEEPREFSFDREGFIIKSSLLESANASEWQMVFEENGSPGYSAPLIFSDASICSQKDEDGRTCDTTQFEDVSNVSLQGEMTERGVEVKRVTFVE